MLNLDRRSASLGTSFNGRVQKKGNSGDKVPAFDVSVEGIVLGEKEFNALLGDPHADNAFFEQPGRKATISVPRFPRLGALVLKDKIEGVKVTLWLSGVDKPIELDGCNLAKITLELQDGGTVAMACQVQCAEPGDRAVSKVFDHLGAPINVEVVEAQRDLQDEAA